LTGNVSQPSANALDALYRVFQARNPLEYVCYACGEFVCGWGYCHNAACEDAGALVQCNCWIRGPYALRKHDGVLADARTCVERRPGPALVSSLEPDALVELIRDLTLDLRLLDRTRRLEQPFLRGRRSPRAGQSSNVIRFPGVAAGLELEITGPPPGEALRPAPEWLNRPDTPHEEWPAEEAAPLCEECGEALCAGAHCHKLGCAEWCSPRDCACWHEGTLEADDIDLLALLKAQSGARTARQADLAAALALIDRLAARYSRLQSSMAF
jgi:hypothetical protein